MFMQTTLLLHESVTVLRLNRCKYCGKIPSMYGENLFCNKLQADNVGLFSV